MGIVKYPLRSFTLYDAPAAILWGTYSALIGYVGGSAFEEDPLKGLLLGLGIALAITVLIEASRYVRRHLPSSGRP
jgi:membrane protein DedA with SNARE-associated domain